MSVAPPEPARFPRIFVVALAFAQLVSWGSLYYAFAVIVEPMRAELGWDKPSVNAALSIGLAVTGLVSFSIGRVIDRYGGRLLMTTGSIAAAVLLLVWSQITALWQLYAIWIAMGVIFAMVLYEPVFAVIARELKADYRRGIITITLLGGLASTVFIPLTHGLVEGLGWRMALVFLGVLQVPCGVLIHWLTLKGTGAGEGRHQVAELVPPDRMRRAVRNPIFWLLSLSYAAHAFMFTTITFHILPLLGERGIAMNEAVLAYSLVGPAQVLGRSVVFLFEARIGVRLAGIVATTLPAIGAALLFAATPGSLALMAFAVLYGSGMGVKTIVQATAAPEFLGREGYGALQGALAIMVYVTQAAAPFLAALLWVYGGGYDLVMWSILGAAVLSAAAFAAAASLPAAR